MLSQNRLCLCERIVLHDDGAQSPALVLEITDGEPGKTKISTNEPLTRLTGAGTEGKGILVLCTKMAVRA